MAEVHEAQYLEMDDLVDMINKAGIPARWVEEARRTRRDKLEGVKGLKADHISWNARTRNYLVTLVADE